MAGGRRPPLRGPPPRRRGVRRGRGGAGEGRARAQRADALRARLLRQQPAPRPRGSRGHPRPSACVHRRRRGARRPARRHVHRPRPRPLGGREPARRRGRLPAARRLRRAARREADDRELRDGGLAPRRLPGQPGLLPRAVGVDVRARALPQLRPVAPVVAGHRPRRRPAALRRPRPPRPRQGRRDLSPAARPLRLLRAHVHSRRGPVGHGLVALPHPRPRPDRLPRAVSTRSTRAASTASCRSSTRTRCGAERPRRWSRACGSPTPTCARWWSDDGHPGGPRAREGVPGRDRAPGRRPRCREGRGPLPARAQRGRQVDAHQVRLRRGGADRGRDPVRRGAASLGRPGRIACPGRGDDLPGARPGR